MEIGQSIDINGGSCFLMLYIVPLSVPSCWNTFIYIHTHTRAIHTFKFGFVLTLQPIPYLLYSPSPSKLRLQIRMQPLQRIEIRLARRPANAQPLRLVRLGDHVEMHVVDHLMRDAPVVLQHVVVLSAADGGKLLNHR